MNDDAILVAEARNGSSESFRQLVLGNQNHVFAILHRYERDRHLLEDLAQDTFTKAWRALNSYDGRAPFQHWLSRIAVNVAIDHVRRRRRLSGGVSFSDLGEDVHEWLHDEVPVRDLEARQAREILDLAMKALSPAERVVITLLEIEDRSIKEVSLITGYTNIAVRVRAVRARAKLRKAIERLQKAEP